MTISLPAITATPVDPQAAVAALAQGDTAAFADLLADTLEKLARGPGTLPDGAAFLAGLGESDDGDESGATPGLDALLAAVNPVPVALNPGAVQAPCDGVSRPDGDSGARSARGGPAELRAEIQGERRAGLQDAVTGLAAAADEAHGAVKGMAARIAALGEENPVASIDDSRPLNVQGTTHPAPAPLAQEARPVQVPGPALRLDAAHLPRELDQRISWMAGERIQSAEIRLDPPELGPVEIRLTVSDGQANASFYAQHASVRDSIEAALPRLREMLAASGINLGGAVVTGESFAGQQGWGEGRESRGGNGGGGRQSHVAELPQIMRSGRGLVDLFA